ncbi:MmcQ/YjbR family DNA-binding protein [Clostridium chromiireducens]|nr:MmcQ/YjbR family DNA-binding protein [Clostridium chromiireducens]MVX63535.1 MmcQ/YjbR family DNA-binding protein [Clostridium chromiireducens]RII33758.1 MmcQ/YjbR family DNA-binding protein [Clostridium chromiireducens]
MKYEWVDEYCLSKKGADKDFKEEWNATRYLIRGKMFVMLGGDKEGKPIITIKCDPSFGRFLRDEYEDIIAGYYMNKEHWNSVYIEGKVPDEVVKQMIDMSYNLIFNSFSKKAQKEIIEE